jgi:hypothetical protein
MAVLQRQYARETNSGISCRNNYYVIYVTKLVHTINVTERLLVGEPELTIFK